MAGGGRLRAAEYGSGGVEVSALSVAGDGGRGGNGGVGAVLTLLGWL